MKKIIFILLLIFCTSCSSSSDKKSDITEQQNEDNKGFYTSLGTGIEIKFYNDKIYFANNENLYEITKDLNNIKLLSNDVTSFNIFDNYLYSNKLKLNLETSVIETLQNLIFVDEEVMLLQPAPNMFKVTQIKNNFTTEIILTNGEFLKKVGNKIFFQQNMISYSSLYYLELGRTELKLINTEQRDELWNKFEPSLLMPEMSKAEEWQLKHYMDIDDIIVSGDKVIYEYRVDNCDLSESGIGANGVENRIIEIGLNGENKRLEGQRTRYGDGGDIISKGPDLSAFDLNVKGYEVKDEKYKADFVTNLGKRNIHISKLDAEFNKYVEVCKIMKNYPSYPDNFWEEATVTDLEAVLYVEVRQGRYVGWRSKLNNCDHYFINKANQKCVNMVNGKLINVVEENKLYASHIKNFFDEDLEEDFNNLASYYGYEEQHWDGCSSWCSVNSFNNISFASSVLKDNLNIDYSADNVLKDDRNCSWVEGVKGDGIGEYIEISQSCLVVSENYKTDIAFKEICIVNGYAKTESLWEANNRVKELKMYFDNKYVATITLEDTILPQYIDISSLGLKVNNGENAKFKFEIADVYKGNKYDDTALTGIVIEFSGRTGH